MTNQNQKIKYILYARKSSESEDRQIASIDSQIDELTKSAKRLGLKVTDILSETKSAKAPVRPVFNEMIRRIHKGEVQGIICWKLDRLARNPIDGGQISWMLQQGVIQHIQTYDKSYYPTDNVLMMSVEFGMANQFIRDLSQSTKRGLRAKAEKGWYPTFSPVGYMHNLFKKKGEKEILKDPERFDLVRKMWDLMLTGNHNPPKILKIATEQWGLTNRFNGKLSRGTIYTIFANSFYYGMYEYPKGSGNWYKGRHEAMITPEEYDRVQALMGRKGRPRPKTHIFDFTGMMRCGECGAIITAEEKIKRQKNGNVHRYIYYHCTKRVNPNCTQGSVEETELKKQILKTIESIQIPQEFHEWAMGWFRKENEKEADSRNTILESQQKAYNLCVKKLDGLIDMRAAGELTEGEFSEKKSILIREKMKFEELLSDTHQRVDKWLKTAEDVFTFARDAKTRFETGTFETRKSVLSTLGQNLILKDRILRINLDNALLPMQSVSAEVKKIHNRFEPLKNRINKNKLEHSYSSCRELLRGRDSNAQPRR